MKKVTFLFCSLFIPFFYLLPQTYTVRWNDVNDSYEVLETNLNSGNATLLGSSSIGVMDSYYALDDILFDETSNQIVALHNNENIWKFNLSTKTDALININTESFIRALTVHNGMFYGIQWNDSNNTYEILEINSDNGNVTLLGSSSAGVMNDYYALDYIFFDESSNQIVALHDNRNIWKFNLSTNTDTLVNINTESFIRALVVSNSGSSNIVNTQDNTSSQVVGYYSILGQKLPKEPASGIYIVLYENGNAKKVVK